MIINTMRLNRKDIQLPAKCWPLVSRFLLDKSKSRHLATILGNRLLIGLLVVNYLDLSEEDLDEIASIAQRGGIDFATSNVIRRISLDIRKKGI